MNPLASILKRHSISTKSNSWIELQFPNGSNFFIKPMARCRGITRANSRPNGFIWHNPKEIVVTPELLEWLETEFRYIFDSNAFLWAASINSAPIQLQSILKEVYE